MTFFLTTVGAIVVAVVGYVLTYFNNLRLSERKDQLDRVNRQLGELYGPLFALDNASQVARHSFLKRYAAGRGSFFAKNIEHSEEDLRVWRQWMQTVFMPMNVRIYDLILSRSDLLIEPTMPTCLITVCAHVASYKVVLENWQQGIYSEHTALVPFPREFHDYAMRSFDLLKSKQTQLLRARP